VAAFVQQIATNLDRRSSSSMVNGTGRMNPEAAR
jgi:hypothetical protein